MSARKNQAKASPKKVSGPRTQSSALARTGDFAALVALVARVVAIIEGACSRVLPRGVLAAEHCDF